MYSQGSRVQWVGEGACSLNQRGLEGGERWRVREGESPVVGVEDIEGLELREEEVSMSQGGPWEVGEPESKSDSIDELPVLGPASELLMER